MMHYSNTVVTLTSLEGVPYREYGHSREGKLSHVQVYMPFDSEYQFLFKVQDGKRRRLELYIDGTLITRDLILPSGISHLDRFVDVRKHFKFVPVDRPEVQDPSSPSNSTIEVKLYKEIQPKPEVRFLRCCNVSYSTAGATIEGSESTQTFGTTSWKGDAEEPNVFKFTLIGKENTIKKAIKCPYCSTYNRMEAKNCSDCGCEFL